MAGVAITGPASKAFGKKRAMIGLFTASTLTSALPILLRLLNVLPGNGSGWVFTILWFDAFLATTLAIAGFVIISSMIADVVEDARRHRRCARRACCCGQRPAAQVHQRYRASSSAGCC